MLSQIETDLMETFFQSHYQSQQQIGVHQNCLPIIYTSDTLLQKMDQRLNQSES